MHRSTSDTTTYADKAVQTQDASALTNSTTLPSQNTLGLDTVVPSTASLLEEKPIVLDTAYICSFPLDCSPVSSKLGPRRSPLASRRTYKHPQLPYSRPPRASSLERRVVSFPETVSCSTNMTVPAVEGPSLRIVSLPKVETRPLSRSPTTTEENSSVEYLEISTDASSLRSSATGPMHLKIRTFPPSDMPATPSPPSSPESILIIGKHHGSPRPFLHETSGSADSAFNTSEDEAGWITWTSSPPRPIPALHGPLSLPYARCPSGAEGTIIEDADLPRMIWGLDLDESHANPLRKLSSVTVASTQPRHVVIGKNTSGTLRAPGSLSSLMNATSDRLYRGNATMNIKRPPGQRVNIRIQDSRTNYARSQYLWHHTLNDGSLAQAGDVDAGGENPSISLAPEHHMLSDLNSSAPAFIPSTVTSQPASETFPRVFVERRSQFTAGRRLSALEIAQGYCIEQQQNAGDLTPPTHSSPIWESTMFSCYSPSSLSPQEPGFLNTQQTPLEHCCASGSVSLPGRDFSEELRQIEAAKRELRSIIGLPGVPRSDFNSNPGWNVMKSLAPIPVPQDVYRRSSPVIDVSLILNQQTSSLPHSTNSLIQGTMTSSNLAKPQLSESVPQPRNLSGQKPQSVPLTRLLERRLSSVAEEGVSYATNFDASLRNGRYVNSHPHPAPEGKFHNISPPGSSINKNVKLNSKTIGEGPNSRKESKTYGKTVVKYANKQNGRTNENTEKDDRRGENAFNAVEGTNLENTASKKRRPQRKTRGTSVSSSQA